MGEAGSSNPEGCFLVASLLLELRTFESTRWEDVDRASPFGLPVLAGEPLTVGLDRSMAGMSKGSVRFLGGVERLVLASLLGGRSGRCSALPPLPCSLSKPSLERMVLLAVLAPSLAVCGGLGSWPKPREKPPTPMPRPSPRGSRLALPLPLMVLLLPRPTLDVFDEA